MKSAAENTSMNGAETSIYTFAELRKTQSICSACRKSGSLIILISRKAFVAISERTNKAKPI